MREDRQCHWNGVGAVEGKAQDETEMMIETAVLMVVSLTVTGGPQDPAPISTSYSSTKLGAVLCGQPNGPGWKASALQSISRMTK